MSKRKKASIYDISSNHARAVECEAEAIAQSARNGEISGLSYAATSPGRAMTIGVAGTHREREQAVYALFRAAVTLVNAA